MTKKQPQMLRNSQESPSEIQSMSQIRHASKIQNASKPPKTPRLIVISGPSGVGKGTIIRSLLSTFDRLRVAISATTRAPRKGEVHGEAYFFLTEEDFDQEIEADNFIEWCPVHLHRYGTLKNQVINSLNQGHWVVLEIDVEGTRKIKTQFPDALTVFVAPPSMEELKRRLISRQTEPEDVLEKRLIVAKNEIERQNEYDYSIVNDDLDAAIAQISSIVAKELY